MASDNEASCVSDPNFAVICSFLECFGKSCGINYPDIASLQEMLEDAHEVPQPLIELHIKLLRKARKTVSPEKWERSLVKFCHTYSNQDGWELERFGYKKARIAVKLRLLKVLLEAQFDLNPRFKNEVNKLAAEQLRVEPLGRDKTGLAYWFQLDEECNIRVYREDLDEENWQLVARDREGVVSLINSLSDGEAGPIPINEDSNSLEISEKPIIDTGQVEESSSPEEDSRLENNIPNDAKTDLVAPLVINNKVPNKVVVDEESLDNNANDEEDGEDEEEDDEEEGDEEEVSNEESSKQNSDDDEEDDDEEEDEEEEDDDDEDDEEDSQDASENQEDSTPAVTSSRIVENHVPQVVQAKQQPVVEKQVPRVPWKVVTPEVTCIPITVDSSQSLKPVVPRSNIVEATPPKAIETPVITTSPLKLVNIQDLQHPIEDRIQREEKYSIKSSHPFQTSDSGMSLGKFPSKPIEKLAANLSRIQSEKLEKPGAAKLLEKIAENLARSSGAAAAHGSLMNGDDDKVQQDFIARSIAEKSNSGNIPVRAQRGMDLSTSPRGWENSNDHSRPMDYSGIDLSSRKSTKPIDIHQAGYRNQEFQHREMDLSTRKIAKPEINPLAYDPRTVILRNHTMVTDLSKKQMSFSAYDMPAAAAYHNAAARIPVKDEHRLPNYTILSDPSKIASMRMAGGPLKRPLEIVEDPQQEMLKRMRADTITLRGAMEKRPMPMVGGLRRDDVGPAIEEPVMMIHGEGSGSDCDAVNPIIGEAIEEQVIFFYGDGTGHECDTGNPGDETSSDNKESNESKNEGCSDVSTSLAPTKILPGDGSVNDPSSASSADPTRSSPFKINANYAQSSSNASVTTDNCQSTVVSSVSPKSKFKPTLGVQVIERSSTTASSSSGSSTSGVTSKKLSRWDVRRPEGAKSEECDSSIVSSEGHISSADESINVDEYQNIDTNRTVAETDSVVEGKSESDDITSTSNQTFSQRKIAECSSSVGGSDDRVEREEVPSVIQPDSSFATEKSAQCDSSVAPSSSADHAVQSVESTVREECTSDKASIQRKSVNDGTGSPPRFFFGPNCVSYTSKNDQAAANQIATTSVTGRESAVLERTDVAKNNNNFVKIPDTYNSETSEGSCESNIETRLKNVELKEESKPDSASADKSDEAGQSECRVQSSTGPNAKDETDFVATSEPTDDLRVSCEVKEEKIVESLAESVDTTDPIESTPITESTSSKRLDFHAVEAKAETCVPQVQLPTVETIESSTIKDETDKLSEAKTTSSIALDESPMEVDEEERNKIDEQRILSEAEPSREVNEPEEEKEDTRQTSDSNDLLPLSISNEAQSSSLHETPDDSCQTIDTIDDKPEENKQLELSSDIDDKTKQSTESEDDSIAIVKNNKEKTNELCNEDAQDGFSKSSEIVDETKDNAASSSNVPKVQESEQLSLDENAITSVELPEDSSVDSEAASSASLLVNPSGGEDSINSDREICEPLSLLESSDHSPADEELPVDEVSPVAIIDSNISKSPERISISTQKASSSTRLLDALDTYTDDLSENPSSGDQDSNEAMVIDDRTSDSNESTNFRGKVTSIEMPAKESVAESESATKSVEATCESMPVADKTVEKSDEIKDTNNREDAQTTRPLDSNFDNAEDAKNSDDAKNETPTTETVEEKESRHTAASSKIDDTPVAAIEVQEKTVTSLQSSLVPNYDCSDDDDVSDDVFETQSIETKDIEEKVTIEKSILQKEDEIKDDDRLSKVEESKSIELVEAKTSAVDLSSESKDTLVPEESKAIPCENNKDFSEAEFANEEDDDSGEKLHIDLEECTNKKFDTLEKHEVDEEQKPSVTMDSGESHENPSESLQAIEKPMDVASKITEKSCDLSDDVVSTSDVQDLSVSQKLKESPVAVFVPNDSEIASKVPDTMQVESKGIEQTICEKTARKEPFTEESSKSNEILAETPLEEKYIGSHPMEKVASNYEDGNNVKIIDDSKPTVEPVVPMASEPSKPEVLVDVSLRDECKVKSPLPSKIHDETNLLSAKEPDMPKSFEVSEEKSKSPSESLDEKETDSLSVKKYDIPKSFEVSDEKSELPSKSRDEEETSPLPVKEHDISKSSKSHKQEVTNPYSAKEYDIPKSSKSHEQEEASPLPVKEYHIPKSFKSHEQEGTNPLPTKEYDIPRSSKSRDQEEKNLLPVKEHDIPKSSKVPVASEVVANPVTSQRPEKISANNALPEVEVSGPSKEKISNVRSLNRESNVSKTSVNDTTEKPKEIHTLHSASMTLDRVEISDATFHKNESKKEASKRLHDVSDGDDFPPTKSKPRNVDFAKDIVDYRLNDEKSSSDDKNIVNRPEVPTQVAFTSVATSGDVIAATTLPQSETDIFDKLKNHDVRDHRENFVKSSIQVEAPRESKSSEIQSVEVKCVNLESDDSMGIDNESMFDTTAEDVDPLACTEEDLNKPTELEISSVPKIGIRVKPVEDLVYEGWKLDSPETVESLPPPPPPPPPRTVSRKRRNSAHESNSDDNTIKLDDEDAAEAGGKRMKLRGKRSPDMKLRKSVEQSRPETMSSEDEASKAQTTDDIVELKNSGDTQAALEKEINDRKPRGRPRGKRRRGNRSIARVTRASKSVGSTPTVIEPAETVDVAETVEATGPNENILAPVPTAAVPAVEVGQVESKKKRKKRKMVLGLEVGIDIVVPDSQTGQDEVPVRQSRRIAQLKIKEEADKRRIEEETLGDMKEKKDRGDGTEKKKRKKQKPESEEEPIIVVKEVEREVKLKKRRKKKKFSAKEFNEANPWQSSSGSSTSDEHQEDEDEEEIESEGSLLFKSDHEFSPESDLEKDDESEPLRRARTAQKATSDVEEAEDEYACQKCGKADHPEWILLCDTCDKGWHCSCLRPALMLIPEGDWFCPPCQHNVLVTKLRDSLKTFDQNSKRHENEVLRKKRLAFVGISLDNVIHKTEAGRGDHSSSRESNSSSSSSESSSSTSSSEESEPVYQLRERRCANTYKFNEYDDMINAAIQDEVEAVQGAGNQGRGKDIATIVNAEKEEAQAEALKTRQIDDDEEDETKKSEKDSDEDYKVEKEDVDDDEEDTARKIVVKKTLSRKKHRKLNSLDISSEDDPESDEDFKGSSSDDEEDFDDQMYSSDDSFAQSRRRGRKGEARAVRRSTRTARKTRYDEDFINDDSDDSDRPKRKKSRSVWEGSESEDSDNSWRQKKKKSRTAPTPRFRATSKSKSRKKKKRKRIIEPDNMSDNEDAVEAQHEDVDEKEETEVQPEKQAAEPSEENVVVSSENVVVTGENHETEQVVEKVENFESPNADDELPKKKKKESTPKQKKTPGIRRKIVYGGLEDDGPRQEEETLARRTRGRKINYQDIMGSDSEEELKKVLRKTEESEDEFVVNDGEEFNEDAEKDSDSGDIYSPKKEIPKGKAKSPKTKKPKKSKSPGGRKSLTDNGTPKERKKPGPKPGSKNRPRQSSLTIAPNPQPKDTDSITRGLDMEGSTMSATGSVIGEVPEGSLTGLTPEDINALDDEQIEQMMMEDEEYGRRQLELAAIEIAKNKKQEEREAKKLEKARLKALEILAAEQQQQQHRDPNAPDGGTDGEAPKKKKRGRRSKAEILAEQMRRDGVPSLLPGSMIPAVVQEVTTNLTTNVTTNPTLPTVVSSIETERSPDPHVPLMAGPDGQLFSPDGSPMKPKRRGRGKGKKTLALEAARAAEAAAKAAAETGPIGITGTDSNPEVKHDDIPNVLPTPGSSTSGSAPPTPPASSSVVVGSQGHQPPAQSPNQQQTVVYPSLPPSQQSSVITRMLQSQPVSSTPQSFTAAAAAMGHKYFGGPNSAGQMMAGPRPSNYDMPARGRIPSPYRQPGPSPMPPHFAAIRSGAPPMRMRGPGPQLYHTPHHPMDPSPSGGGPISINSRDRSSPLGPVPGGPAMIPPAAGSPLAKGGPTPPPPPYVRGGPALSRFPDNPQMGPRHQVPTFPTPSPGNHNMQQPSPPPNRPPGNFSPYHPPPPPNYHYGAYPPPPPMTTADDAAAYQGSPYSAEHFSTPAESQPQIQQPPPPPPPQPGPPQPHANEPPSGPVNKQYDEEGTGEFGGLVSYFSSQREDDLDS